MNRWLLSGVAALLLIGGFADAAADDRPAPDGPPLLVLDQFGYRPGMTKIAVLRDPRIGDDSDASLTPAARYHVIDVASGDAVMTLTPTAWRDGAVDEASGDAVWHLNFSSLDRPGRYRIEDAEGELVSPAFGIGEDVYAPVLKAALKTFFYQRAGQAKAPPHADPRWADEASHMGPGQDREARRWDAPDDAGTARDLSGGWYDAGDYNKYTSWTADYVIALVTTWMENPGAFDDALGIPESGNDVPDILDEARWGLDWLIRMQNEDGGVLSILDVDEASPPSAATGPSRYGPASTSATLTTAGAFALASEAFGAVGEADYAANLIARAEDAWNWAEANPNVVFWNNDEARGTEGVGYGQQEVDEEGRREKKLSAAIYLARATGGRRYHAYVAANYRSSSLVGNFYTDPFRMVPTRALLQYAEAPGADEAVVGVIEQRYADAMAHENLWAATDAARDPYRAHIGAYTWGSSSTKARQGVMFLQQTDRGIGDPAPDEARDAAAGYLHYMHGTNPLGRVYLTNMGEFGAERSADTIYHAWFTDGSERWDDLRTSEVGPAPGFVPGGPNPSYDWDACCPASCGDDGEVPCGASPPSPPQGQPPMKSYAQFNDGWPLNSWSVTENSNGYQIAYIRLLARFVGEEDGR